MKFLNNYSYFFCRRNKLDWNYVALNKPGRINNNPNGICRDVKINNK